MTGSDDYSNEHAHLVESLSALGDTGRLFAALLGKNANAKLVMAVAKDMALNADEPYGNWSQTRLKAVCAILGGIIDLDEANGWFDNRSTEDAR